MTSRTLDSDAIRWYRRHNIHGRWLLLDYMIRKLREAEEFYCTLTMCTHLHDVIQQKERVLTAILQNTDIIGITLVR
jgi:hypothetical protein